MKGAFQYSKLTTHPYRRNLN